MNVGTYRESRVKVSLEIKKEIVRLMQTEGDTGQKKKHPAKWYRNAVSTNLSLAEGANPSIRAYEVTITKLRDILKATNPLDEEWHLGTLMQYPISPDALAKIIQFKLWAIKNHGFDWELSIREALWMARFSALPLAVSKLQVIAMNYAAREQLHELIGDEYEFTSAFDLEAILTPLLDRPEVMLKESTPTLEGLTKALETIKREVTPERAKMIQEKIKKHKQESEK